MMIVTMLSVMIMMTRMENGDDGADKDEDDIVSGNSSRNIGNHLCWVGFS